MKSAAAACGFENHIRGERDVTELLVQTFHELCTGKTVEGAAVQQLSSVLSTGRGGFSGGKRPRFMRSFGSGK